MNYRYEIVPETEDANPREINDNFCHLSLCHRKYNIGDKDASFNPKNFNGWDEVQAWLEDDKDAHLIIPVSATDHSCFVIYLGEPKESYDSGRVGFAWVTEEELHKEFGYGQEAIDKAKELIKAEVEEYSKYLNGEFVCALIYDENDSVVDSCGNFADEEDAKAWAEEAIVDLQHDDAQEEFTPYEQMMFDF